MENKYKLVETLADNNWDKFVENSPNGTIFSNSTYLKASGVKYKLFYCFKKLELRAAVSILEHEDAKTTVLDDLIIYNGIMYNRPPTQQTHAQQLSEQFKLQEFIANELTKLYKKIVLSLHPSVLDIRAILWVNYGTNMPKYNLDIRYTSYIKVADFKTSKKLEDISIYSKASNSRRQQIRYAMKKGYNTKTISDIQILLNFYIKTMDRQHINVEEKKLKKIEKLVTILLQKNMAKIYASYDEKNELGSLAVFGVDNKRAYYIFGANDPEKRDGHSGTNVLWQAFHDLSSKGIDEVDLEGINSPNRGWFKLSFGGDVIPYFEISYRS